MQDSTFADIDFSPFSSFTFKVNHIFMEEREKLVEKIVINEEELDGIETDDILDSENLPRTVFIDQEYWNLKEVVNEGELTTNIN